MPKYLKIFHLSMLHTFKNYKALLSLSFFLIICLLIFSNLWKIIAAKMGSFHLNPVELLWYIALNEWVLIALPRPEREIEHDLKSGKLAYSLPKPISYLKATFFESLGVFCVNLSVLGIVAFGFTWLQAGGFPAPLWVVPIIIITGLLAGILCILFQMLIGLSAFWIHEVEPIAWIWEKLLFALGGLILPLSVYPIWLQTIAKYTPFPYILGDRSAFVIDHTIGPMLIVIAGIGLWCLLCSWTIWFLYQKALKILNSEGG